MNYVLPVHLLAGDCPSWQPIKIKLCSVSIIAFLQHNIYILKRIEKFLNFTLSILCIALYNAISSHRVTALLNHIWLLFISVGRSVWNICFPYLKSNGSLSWHIYWAHKDSIILISFKKVYVCFYGNTYAANDCRAKYNSNRFVPVIKPSLIISDSLSADISSENMTSFNPEEAFSTTSLINVVSCNKF